MTYDQDYGPDRCACGRCAVPGSYECDDCLHGGRPKVDQPTGVTMTRRQIKEELWGWQDYLARARQEGWPKGRWIIRAEQKVAECRRLLDSKGDAA